MNWTLIFDWIRRKYFLFWKSFSGILCPLVSSTHHVYASFSNKLLTLRFAIDTNVSSANTEWMPPFFSGKAFFNFGDFFGSFNQRTSSLAFFKFYSNGRGTRSYCWWWSFRATKLFITRNCEINFCVWYKVEVLQRSTFIILETGVFNCTEQNIHNKLALDWLY